MPIFRRLEARMPPARFGCDAALSARYQRGFRSGIQGASAPRHQTSREPRARMRDRRPCLARVDIGLSPPSRGKRRDAIDAYLQDVVNASFPILAYDEAAATWHGHERARLEGLGRSAPFTDGQIASIAHVNGLTLVTFNVKDFAHFKDLSVTAWTTLIGPATDPNCTPMFVFFSNRLGCAGSIGVRSPARSCSSS